MVCRLKFKLKNQQLNEQDELSVKNAQLSYKCIYDRKVCCKKTESLNRMAEHICKFHLDNTEVKELLDSYVDELGPMRFKDLLIVGGGVYFIGQKS